MKLREVFTPRPRAVLSAVFFALFEGIFWKYGVYFFAGEWIRIIGVAVAVYCFSLFITHAGHEVRDAPPSQAVPPPEEVLDAQT